MTKDITDALRQAADMEAVYRMFDGRGYLLYVGITGDIGKRLGNHSLRRWFPLVKRIELEWLPSRAAALEAERCAISTERPLYNQAGTGPLKRPASTTAVKAEPLFEAEPLIEPRDLLADLDAVLADHRVKIRDAIGLLRSLAPGHQPYQEMTAVRLRNELQRKGVRTINSSGTPCLDPADLRKVRVSATSMRNSA